MAVETKAHADLDSTIGILTDELVAKFKNNELLKKVWYAARKIMPNSRILFTEDVEVENIPSTVLIALTNATHEECDEVGRAVFPDYNWEIYGMFGSPLYVQPFTNICPDTYDVTELWGE